MAFLPLLAHHHQQRQSAAATPALLMRMLASLLLDMEISDAPLHRQLAQAWGVLGEQQELLRAALVLLADHELNTSTFTVRCVASTGASLAASLCAGLAALSGPEHGRHYVLARQVMDAELAAPDSPSTPAMRPGFGHPLYPAGDPRAAFLLEQLGRMRPSRAEGVLALAAKASATRGAEPNSDFALVALELALDLPPDSGLVLFALARCAGWLAHAAEQAAEGRLIRPRARYIGDFGA